MFQLSSQLLEKYPGLVAFGWRATYHGPTEDELPSLTEAAEDRGISKSRARNMTSFFRELGAKGKSPIEFQVEKAADGDLDYSRRSFLVDYLLYAEIWSGFLIGLHDRQALGEDLVFGLAREVGVPEFEHISRRLITLRPDEPALIASGKVVASLRHGPDYSTRIQNNSTSLWGVMFASPADNYELAKRTAKEIIDDGVARKIWTPDD